MIQGLLNDLNYIEDLGESSEIMKKINQGYSKLNLSKYLEIVNLSYILSKQR